MGASVHLTLISQAEKQMLIIYNKGKHWAIRFCAYRTIISVGRGTSILTVLRTMCLSAVLSNNSKTNAKIHFLYTAIYCIQQTHTLILNNVDLSNKHLMPQTPQQNPAVRSPLFMFFISFLICGKYYSIIGLKNQEVVM